jgi:hypothetical protein
VSGAGCLLDGPIQVDMAEMTARYGEQGAALLRECDLGGGRGRSFPLPPPPAFSYHAEDCTASCMGDRVL